MRATEEEDGEKKKVRSEHVLIPVWSGGAVSAGLRPKYPVSHVMRRVEASATRTYRYINGGRVDAILHRRVGGVVMKAQARPDWGWQRVPRGREPLRTMSGGQAIGQDQ